MFGTIQDIEAARTAQRKTLRKEDARAAAAESGQDGGRVCLTRQEGNEGDSRHVLFVVSKS